MKMTIGLAFVLMLGTYAQADRIVMNSLATVNGQGGLKNNGPFNVVFETSFDEDFADFTVVASTSSNIPTSFPAQFSGFADIMQQAGRIFLFDDTQDFEVTIIAPFQDLTTLTFDNFEPLVRDGVLLLNYKWYDPTYSTNFDAWWEASVMEPNIKNIRVVPEPTALALMLLGTCLLLRCR